MTVSDPVKAAARAAARLRREAAAQEGTAVAPALVDRFLAAVPVPSDAVVAGYWPIGTEFDVRPLLHRLAARGVACALPVVAGRGQPLIFRRWTPETVLEPGMFGVMTPTAAASPVVPTLLLVPLLAFDRSGHRLGYGAGFYDRTLAALRAAGGKVTAVGIGYAAQEAADLPHDIYDEPLDWLVTDRFALRPTKRQVPQR